jgi:cytochrome c oxidase subunit 2
MLWTTGTIFVIVFSLFLAGALRRRGGTRPATSTKTLTRAVSAGVAMTVVVLFGFLAASVATGRAAVSTPQENAVPIQLIGHQWWWEVVYENPIPARQVTTANEIHVPIGRPIALKVTSRDVIHSFWTPNLTGKRDLIPGYTTGVWLFIDKPGVYHGQCAEFCGRQHAHMGLDVVAEDDHEFEEWLDGQRQPALEPKTEQPIAGRAVFMGSRCSACHTIRGTPANGRIAPDLTHFASRSAIGASSRPNTSEHLLEWIRNPHAVKPGNEMPANPLGEDNLEAVVAYLEGLK